MRNEKVLIKLLRSVVDLLGDEASRNPAFAERLNGIVRDSLPAPKEAKTPKAVPATPVPLPDLHAEWSRLSEMDFRMWLRDQPVALLRAIIRSQDFDSARRTYDNAVRGAAREKIGWKSEGHGSFREAAL